MSDLDKISGLPKEIFDFRAIEKESTQKLKVFTTTKRYKKLVTVVEGLTGEELERTTKDLKHKLACGGSCKAGSIVLQGDHKEKVRKHLVELGYPAEVISVV